MNLLCLDYGLKHIGIAIATTPIAEPLLTIDTNQALDRLPPLINSHHIDHIIIGLPQGRVEESVHQFVSNLKSQVAIPIILHDETLSSKEAHQQLAHANKKTRSGPDHHYAAAIILQDYLDQTKVNG